MLTGETGSLTWVIIREMVYGYGIWIVDRVVKCWACWALMSYLSFLDQILQLWAWTIISSDVNM